MDELSKRISIDYLENCKLIRRDEWQAREPRNTSILKLPVPYVVIHHSYTPPACYSREQCCSAMKQMQDYHMDHHKWSDIGYNFAVGGDGSIYEGRGWLIEGAHAYNFNPISLGICLIGDWCNSIPPPAQTKAVQALIAAGVKHGYLTENYKLIGHRQVRDTQCPGKALFELIKTWNHYSSFPASVDDLLDVKELPEYMKRIIKENLKKVSM